MIKPLFIPLKRQYFEEFEQGKKQFEYRTYGSRWNEQTCLVGRRVIISLGYGKQRRTEGKIVSFDTCATPQLLPGWSHCFGDSHFTAAVIGIRLNKKARPIVSPPGSAALVTEGDKKNLTASH
jgi:hypothetical protein